jgi:hypothetical protein
MVESSPWYKNLPIDRGDLPESYGSVGVKTDGGGSMAGRGRVGPMRLHRACNLRSMEALQAALDAGDDVNEVEAVRAAAARVEARLSRPPPRRATRRSTTPPTRAGWRASPSCWTGALR